MSQKSANPERDKGLGGVFVWSPHHREIMNKREGEINKPPSHYPHGKVSRFLFCSTLSTLQNPQRSSGHPGLHPRYDLQTIWDEGGMGAQGPPRNPGTGGAGKASFYRQVCNRSLNGLQGDSSQGWGLSISNLRKPTRWEASSKTSVCVLLRQEPPEEMGFL
jgi:hypothetical protein